MQAEFIDNVSLDAMQADDLDAVAAVESAAQITPWTRQAFADCLGNDYYVCQVMRHRQEVIAFQVASFLLDEGHLLNIAVAPAFQRCGLARKLLTQLLESAHQRETNSLFLEVRASNKGAQTLYEQFGFVHYNDRPAYYRCANGHEDAWLMCRQL